MLSRNLFKFNTRLFNINKFKSVDNQSRLIHQVHTDIESFNDYVKQSNKKRTKCSDLDVKYKDIENKYIDLDNKYKDIKNKYIDLDNKHNNLYSKYEDIHYNYNIINDDLKTEKKSANAIMLCTYINTVTIAFHIYTHIC